ncbi:ABC transporter [Phytophthora megakarya]|uniref:ABC transporter n=1 Tax=Phytophthora megakarya TaxID=4795 RepID=A0A225VTU6_9STRA|nr:ABC transporter [Phytophthora megakarya]
MYKQVFQREVDVNLELGSHTNIVQFLKTFSIRNAENEQRHIIVMLFFARSAADLLIQQSPIAYGAIGTIAHDCFKALCHIHSKKYCFVDLKPANIMLHSGEQGGTTLVDFGGAVRLGDPIVEVTDDFCLGVAKLQGSEFLDWTCLGTTMAHLAKIGINYSTREELVSPLRSNTGYAKDFVRQLIVSCLENPSAPLIKKALDRLPTSFCIVDKCPFTLMQIVLRSRHHYRQCRQSICDTPTDRMHRPLSRRCKICPACLAWLCENDFGKRWRVAVFALKLVFSALLNALVTVSALMDSQAEMARFIVAKRFSFAVVAVAFSNSHNAFRFALRGSIMPTSKGWQTEVAFLGNGCRTAQSSSETIASDSLETWHSKLSTSSSAERVMCCCRSDRR